MSHWMLLVGKKLLAASHSAEEHTLLAIMFPYGLVTSSSVVQTRIAIYYLVVPRNSRNLLFGITKFGIHFQKLYFPFFYILQY